ncbi:MAG: MFS transporter, partial [Verrucomicrobiales bacterium]
MRAIKAQYFLAYAPLGSLGPLLPIFLKHGKGFVESQFGILIALTAISMIVTPVLLALLADTRVDSRRLLAGSYLIAAISLVALFFADGVVMVSVLYLIYSLAMMPTLPLTDALFFSVERAAELEGERVSPYQYVRVWGTIGFIVPSLLLYFLIRGDGGAGAIIWVATASCLLAACNAFLLPRIRLG